MNVTCWCWIQMKMWSCAFQIKDEILDNGELLACSQLSVLDVYENAKTMENHNFMLYQR